MKNICFTQIMIGMVVYIGQNLHIEQLLSMIKVEQLGV